MVNVITFGTFDVFHVGHLRILKRASDYGARLIVGISTDQLNYSKKNKYPVYSEAERLEIVKNIGFVDQVFYEESLEKKRKYLIQYDAQVLVMGNDWEGKFDELSDICRVVYLSRTPSISTTQVIEKIRN